MNRNQFQTQLRDIIELLKDCKLYRDYNAFVNYSNCTATLFRHKTYREVWEQCIAQKFYDFILFDDALLQFRADFDEGIFNYVYYEPPFVNYTYADYLVLECGFTNEDIQEIGDQYREEYESYLRDSELREVVTPSRYDYTPNQYREGRHPASHIHIGFGNEIRLGARKILKPLSFMLFVLRQYYPDKWSEYIRGGVDRAVIFRNIRENLEDVDPIYFKHFDQYEMALY